MLATAAYAPMGVSPSLSILDQVRRLIHELIGRLENGDPAHDTIARLSEIVDGAGKAPPDTEAYSRRGEMRELLERGIEEAINRACDWLNRAGAELETMSQTERATRAYEFQRRCG